MPEMIQFTNGSWLQNASHQQQDIVDVVAISQMIANHWVSWLNHWVKQNSCLQFPHRYILSWTSRGGTHQQTCTIVNLSMACCNKSEPEVSHSSSETSDPTHTDSFLANCCTKGWLKYGSHNALQSTLLHFATQAAPPPENHLLLLLLAAAETELHPGSTPFQTTADASCPEIHFILPTSLDTYYYFPLTRPTVQVNLSI